ncbi:hypothetical protein QTO34_009450 [Cnephaeus nilssonii]|uniref:Uncharacterized protein n=1 Tax=Cnephaeus nilssonii TaxID=3371016 RepID=A0AA40HHZ0_CNENI|nr:hypothetical protein QTO34_009450 [Eptesicus nilssonii]
MPTNLFVTSELDSPSLRFLPRLCNLTIVKMVVFKELEKDLIPMVIAMKMQGSNLILMWTTGDRPGADLTAKTPTSSREKATSYRSLCTGGSALRNRSSGATKTLPVGAIHMAEVRQRPLKGGHGLCLCSSINEAFAKVAEIWICSLSGQHILQENSAIQARCKAKSRVNYSKGVYQRFSSEQQANNNATHGLDLAEEGIDMGMPKKQRP